jgi:hypothetical protein
MIFGSFARRRVIFDIAMTVPPNKLHCSHRLSTSNSTLLPCLPTNQWFLELFLASAPHNMPKSFGLSTADRCSLTDCLYEIRMAYVVQQATLCELDQLVPLFDWPTDLNRNGVGSPIHQNGHL